MSRTRRRNQCLFLYVLDLWIFFAPSSATLIILTVHRRLWLLVKSSFSRLPCLLSSALPTNWIWSLIALGVWKAECGESSGFGVIRRWGSAAGGNCSHIKCSVAWPWACFELHRCEHLISCARHHLPVFCCFSLYSLNLGMSHESQLYVVFLLWSGPQDL